MLPFVVETFSNIARGGAVDPPDPNQLYYGQKKRGALIQSEARMETFEWVYYNQNLTKPFLGWSDRISTHLADHYTGDITFQTWVEAINPIRTEKPKMYITSQPPPAVNMANDKMIVMKLVTETLNEKFVHAGYPTVQLPVNPGVIIDTFKANARKLIAKHINDTRDQEKLLSCVEHLVMVYNNRVDRREKEKLEAEKQQDVYDTMTRINKARKEWYDAEIKNEAEVRKVIASYFREILDRPINYSYT